jgi:hypothetical protein
MSLLYQKMKYMCIILVTCLLSKRSLLLNNWTDVPARLSNLAGTLLARDVVELTLARKLRKSIEADRRKFSETDHWRKSIICSVVLNHDGDLVDPRFVD